MLPKRKLVLLFFVLLILWMGATSLKASSPSGRWRGTWTSNSTGHRGPLKARIRRIDQDTYRALFVGRFFVVVPFAYPATLERVPGTCDQFTSSQRLPLIGTYRMHATVTPHHFHANFQSGNDQGVFQMSR